MAATAGQEMTFANEVRANITGLQNAVAQMARRMRDVEQTANSTHSNVQILDQRLTGHESVHDPYLHKVDAQEVTIRNMREQHQHLSDQLNARIPGIEAKMNALDVMIPKGFNMIDQVVSKIENEMTKITTELMND